MSYSKSRLTVFVIDYYKVNELRSIDNPDNMLKTGTLEDLLHVGENGKQPILNILDIPLGGAALNIPTQFQ